MVEDREVRRKVVEHNSPCARVAQEAPKADLHQLVTSARGGSR